MTPVRVAAGLVAVLAALVALVPGPAFAGTQVYSSKMVCADVGLGPVENTVASSIGLPSIVQTAGTGTASLATTTTDVQVKISMAGLPANSPVLCFVACIVDGDHDLFNIHEYVPCGANTNAAGKFNFTTTFPLADIAGGCLLPVVALAVTPAVVPAVAAPVPSSLTVCAPGFGAFEPFEPCDCPVPEE